MTVHDDAVLINAWVFRRKDLNANLRGREGRGGGFEDFYTSVRCREVTGRDEVSGCVCWLLGFQFLMNLCGQEEMGAYDDADCE